MDGSLDLAARGGPARFALEVSRATQLADVSVRILHHLVTLNNISVLQPHLAARLEPEILRRRRLRKIRALNIELTAERKFAGAGTRVFRIIDSAELFDLTFRIICDHDFDRPKHRKPPRRHP